MRTQKAVVVAVVAALAFAGAASAMLGQIEPGGVGLGPSIQPNGMGPVINPGGHEMGPVINPGGHEMGPVINPGGVGL